MTNGCDFWPALIKRMEGESELKNFKNWKTVRDLPIYGHGSHFGIDHYFCFPYLHDLYNWLGTKNPVERQVWKNLLKEPKKGHSDESYESARYYLQDYDKQGSFEVSDWTVKSAHHISIQERFGKKTILDFDQIVEMGPGIGETARIILDLGFKKPYHILDLPAVSRISSYYLSDYPNVCTHKHYSTIPSIENTLFIGTWSFSEVEFSYRNEIVDHFKDRADYLLLWQKKGFEYDNIHYFKEIMPNKLKNSQFIHIPISEHPGYQDSYLIVSKKN